MTKETFVAKFHCDNCRECWSIEVPKKTLIDSLDPECPTCGLTRAEINNLKLKNTAYNSGHYIPVYTQKEKTDE